MKLRFLIVLVASTLYSASSFAYNACMNPNYRRVAEEALNVLANKLGADLQHQARLDAYCEKNWFATIYNDYLTREAGYFSGCGVSVAVASQDELVLFAEDLRLVNEGRDYIDVQDLFAIISVPICGAFKSQSETGSNL